MTGNGRLLSPSLLLVDNRVSAKVEDDDPVAAAAAAVEVTVAGAFDVDDGGFLGVHLPADLGVTTSTEYLFWKALIAAIMGEELAVLLLRLLLGLLGLETSMPSDDHPWAT
jgi:hypothetical protein